MLVLVEDAQGTRLERSRAAPRAAWPVFPEPDLVARLQAQPDVGRICFAVVDEHLAALARGRGLRTRRETIGRRQKLVERLSCLEVRYSPGSITHLRRRTLSCQLSALTLSLTLGDSPDSVRLLPTLSFRHVSCKLSTEVRSPSERASETERSMKSMYKPNISATARFASTVAGAALAIAGYQRSNKAIGALGMGLLARGASGWCPVTAAIDPYAGTTDHQAAIWAAHRGIIVEDAITIYRPVSDVYSYWRNLENLPRFMEHLEEVETRDRFHSHWVARGPLGVLVEWDAEVINDIPPTLLSWKSVGDSDVVSAGSVRFKPVGEHATRSAREAAIRSAGREARRDSGVVVRRRSAASDCRRSPAFQAAAGERERSRPANIARRRRVRGCAAVSTSQETSPAR